jgi:hypothetical protein
MFYFQKKIVGFYVILTQYMPYCDFPASLVEEDLRCPSMHYLRARTDTQVEPPTLFRKLAGQLPHMKELKVPIRI